MKLLKTPDQLLGLDAVAVASAFLVSPCHHGPALRAIGRFQLEATVQSAHVIRRHTEHTGWPAVARCGPLRPNRTACWPRNGKLE